MARPLVTDELWELIEPLIPKVPRRQRFPDRFGRYRQRHHQPDNGRNLRLGTLGFDHGIEL